MLTERRNKMRALAVVLGLVLALGFSSAVAAEVLLLDTAEVPDPASFGDQRCDGAISLRMGATVATNVTRLEAYLDITTANNVRFAIWDHPGHTLLFYSDPVSVSPGLQFVSSPVFSFDMNAGQDYDMAAMVDGCAFFPWDLVTEDTGVLVTYANNGNPINYITPSGPNDCCSVDPRFLIYSETVAVPAMNYWGTLGLILLVLGSLTVMMLRRVRFNTFIALVFVLCIAAGAGAATTFEATGQITAIYSSSFTIDDVDSGRPVHVSWNEDTVWTDPQGRAKSPEDLIVGREVTVTIERRPSQLVATRVTIR